MVATGETDAVTQAAVDPVKPFTGSELRSPDPSSHIRRHRWSRDRPPAGGVATAMDRPPLEAVQHAPPDPVVAHVLALRERTHPLEAPLTVSVRSKSLGSTCAMVRNLNPS